MEQINFEDFEGALLKLPEEKRKEVVKILFEMVQSRFDDKMLRLMATTIKFAKESKADGSEKIDIQEKELDKLTHIQDGNRLLQQKK